MYKVCTYRTRRYATSRLENWVSQVLRSERRAEDLAIAGYAARKREIMSWARYAVAGDYKVAWQQRWVTEYARAKVHFARFCEAAPGCRSHQGRHLSTLSQRLKLQIRKVVGADPEVREVVAI